MPKRNRDVYSSTWDDIGSLEDARDALKYALGQCEGWDVGCEDVIQDAIDELTVQIELLEEQEEANEQVDQAALNRWIEGSVSEFNRPSYTYSLAGGW